MVGVLGATYSVPALSRLREVLNAMEVVHSLIIFLHTEVFVFLQNLPANKNFAIYQMLITKIKMHFFSAKRHW